MGDFNIDDWYPNRYTKVTIYALINPITSIPYYVGSTKQLRLEERLGQHIYQKMHPTTKSLVDAGIKPEIAEIDRTNYEDKSHYELEAFWINKLVGLGFPLENKFKVKPLTHA